MTTLAAFAANPYLHIMDVTTPGSSSRLGTYTPPTSVSFQGLAWYGEHVVCTLNTTTPFRIIDATNPASPTLAGSLGSNSTYLSSPTRVAILGDHAIVVSSGGSRAITAIDISDPTTPVVTGYVVNPGSFDLPFSLALVGDVAFTTSISGPDYLTAIDLSNLASPSVIHSEDPIVPGLTNPVFPDLAAIGDHLFMTVEEDGTGDGLYVVDVSNPAAPSVVGSLTQATAAAMAEPDEITVVNENTVAISHSTTDIVTVVDVTNPASPTLAGSFNNSAVVNSPERLAGHPDGNHVAVPGLASDNFVVLDVSNPASITAVDTLTFSPFYNSAVIVAIQPYPVTSGSLTVGYLRLG